MSHRRPLERERGPQPVPVPVVVLAEPARTPAGHCPKCGAHVGRAVRGHTRHCDGTPPLVSVPVEAAAERVREGRFDVMVG